MAEEQSTTDVAAPCGTAKTFRAWTHEDQQLLASVHAALRHRFPAGKMYPRRHRDTIRLGLVVLDHAVRDPSFWNAFVDSNRRIALAKRSLI